MNLPGFSVSDRLSIERTALANERTLLAYTRTFLGMVGAGAALVKLFDVFWARLLGGVFLALGPVIILFGLWRFFRIRNGLKHIPADPEEDED